VGGKKRNENSGECRLAAWQPKSHGEGELGRGEIRRQVMWEKGGVKF